MHVFSFRLFPSSSLPLTRQESKGKSDEEKDVMLQQKDKHVVELEHSLAALQEELSLLAQQAK